MKNWERVAALVRAAFVEGRLAKETMWQEVVLIHKGKGAYRGIGLVEVMWKVVAEVLNRRLTASITFHDFLHGFWSGSGTGTATLEAKLLQKLDTLREEVLYLIFLDLHKVYDDLNRSNMTRIPRGLRCGTSSVSTPTDILGSAEDGGEGRRLLRVGVKGI